MGNIKRTAVYLRVSGGPGQDLDSQRMALRSYIEKTGTEDFDWIEDVISGRKKKRPKFVALLNSVKAGWVDRIMAFKIDRIGRTALENLELAEAAKQTRTDIVGVADGSRLLSEGGGFIFGLLSLLAERESEETSKRTKAGMAVARAAGKIIGGSGGGITEKVAKLIPTIRLLAEQGYSAWKIAKTLKLNYSTVRPIVRQPNKVFLTRRQVLARVPLSRRGKRYNEAIRTADERTG